MLLSSPVSNDDDGGGGGGGGVVVVVAVAIGSWQYDLVDNAIIALHL